MPDSRSLEIGVRAIKTYFYEVYDDFRLILYDNLFRYKPQAPGGRLAARLADLEPMLATGYEVSDDGLQYTVKLREGVKSEYGNTLDAEDVAWSWHRAYGLKRQGRLNVHWAPVARPEDVVAVDRHTVQITLSAPNVTFPHFLTAKYIPVLDSKECKKHITAADPWASNWLSSHSAGFGPYVVEDYSGGDRLVYGAKREYWGGRPNFDKLVFHGVPDVADRVKMLKQKKLDVVHGLSVDAAHELKQASYPLISVPSHDALLLQMNCLKPPFTDVRVRRAIAYAVPYRQILTECFRGLARPLRSPLPDCCFGYTGEYWLYDTNLEKARELLAESSVPQGFKVSLCYFHAIPEIVKIAETVKQALKELGIEVDLRPMQEGAFRDAEFKRTMDFFLDTHMHIIADGYYVIRTDFGDEKWGVENFAQYYTPEVARMTEQMLFANTEIERLGQIREFQRVVIQDSPQAYLAMINTLVATQTEITGLLADVHGRVYYQYASKANV